MKITALNFGLPGKEVAGYLSEAVSAAGAAGAEVSVIEMSDKKINRCMGCGACSNGVRDGKTNAPFCILKDDLRAIAEAYMDADGILVAAPVTYLGPSGQLMDFIHRVCVAADKSVMELREYQRHKRREPPIDPRFLKQQWVGLISVGEGLDDSEVTFGLPVMKLMSFSSTMKHVGGVDIHGEMTEEKKEGFKAQCRELGNALANAIASADASPAYIGHQGHCPVCHGDTFTLIPGTCQAECPVCGITGTLSLKDGKVVIDYPEGTAFHSRINKGGVIDHCMELHGAEEYCVELWGDLAWTKPRNLKEEIGSWIAQGLIPAPPGWIDKGDIHPRSGKEDAV